MTTNRSSSDNTTAVVGAAIALLIFGALFYLRFCGEVAVPARPTERPLMTVDSKHAVEALNANRDLFRQRIESDAKHYGMASAPTIDELSQPFDHHESKRRIKLVPGKGRPVEVAGLRLQAIHKDHVLALRIENLTKHPVAYRVDTRPALGHRACRAKETLPFNAMALREAGKPGSAEIRSECIYRHGKGLVVTRVETVALPLLSYFYVSRLRPSSVGLTEDAVRGHHPPEGTLCQRSLSGPLETQLRTGQTTWRDMIDFYARHTCGTYRFPSDYKAVEPGSHIQLPVVDAE